MGTSEKINLYIKALIRFIISNWKLPSIVFTITLGLISAGFETQGEWSFLNDTIKIKNIYLWAIIITIISIAYIIIFILQKPFANINKIADGAILGSDEIKNINLFKKVVIIGLSNVGKSTLINSFFGKKFADNRTQAIEGIVKIHKNQLFCIIDISGEQITQAFQTIKQADFIIFIADHSDSNQFKRIIQSRKEETKKYINQIKQHITGNSDKIDVPSLFLINKKDLWETATKTQVDSLKQDYEIIFNDWKNSFSSSHSNTTELIEFSNKNNFSGISANDILDKIHGALIK